MSKYSRETLEPIVETSLSIAEVCRRLEIRPVGGNYKTLKKYFTLLEIDTSHFTGQGWNSGDRYKNFVRNPGSSVIFLPKDARDSLATFSGLSANMNFMPAASANPVLMGAGATVNTSTLCFFNSK